MLPILGAQLGPSSQAAFPHVALSLPTASLTDDECTVCVWNVAVSRPSVDGICQGGNWTRGTSPKRIAEVWEAFRRTDPSLRRARGYWNGGILVPTLRGAQIGENLSLLSLARRGPELLIRAPVPLNQLAALHVFSEEDADSVHRVAPELAVELHSFPDYDSTGVETTRSRVRIDAYFNGVASYPGDLEFDRIRPRTKATVHY